MADALLWAALVRWCDLTALAGVMGGLVVELVVLPSDADELHELRRHVRRFTSAALVLLIVASGGELVTRAWTMAGGGLAASVAALPLVITRTHFGMIWRARAGALALLALLGGTSVRPLRVAALAITVALALTTTLAGHAAEWGDVTATAFVDWLHVVAATAWTGGLFCLTFGVLRVAHGSNRTALVGGIAGRFSRLAGACAAAVLATGIVNASIELVTPSALWTTPYGRILALKSLCVTGLLAFGAANRYRVLPLFPAGDALRDGSERPDAASRAPVTLATYVAREAVLAALVFGCTAFLGQTTPPRHHAGEHAAPIGPSSSKIDEPRTHVPEASPCA